MNASFPNSAPRVDAETQVCAVIGHPVGHSLSPAIHNAAFAALGLNYVYLAFEVEDADAFLAGLRSMPSFRGVSVTIPHKRTVGPFLDAVDPLAAKVGSVNTITNTSGRLEGSSTDGPGALRAFADEGIDLDGRRVLFVGTGGAVRAVAFAMAMDSPDVHLTIAGRTESRVDGLVASLRRETDAGVTGAHLDDDVGSLVRAHDVIVQGTPVGMYPGPAGATLIPKRWLRSDHVVFDMVYNPRLTQLVRDAESAGCRVVYGIDMLLHQAALQFETWTGQAAPLEVMRASAEGALRAIIEAPNQLSGKE